MFRNKSLIAFLAVAATLAFVAVEAMAAPRMNSGSRGSRTYSAPPATQTAPNRRAPDRPLDGAAARPGQPGAATPSRPEPRRPRNHGGMFRPGFGGACWAACRRLPRRRPDRMLTAAASSAAWRVSPRCSGLLLQIGARRC
jgi:hypothetical protein